MPHRFPAVLLLALATAMACAPALALDLTNSTVCGAVPVLKSPGEIAVNRCDKRLFYRDQSGSIGTAALLDAVAAGRKAVETGDAGDLMTIGSGQVARSLSAQFGDTFNVRNFGAVGDGNNHPLSQRFANLTAARVVYPFVTSLSQESDRVAAQAAINAACARGRRRVWWPHGAYVHADAPLTVPCGSVMLEGVGEGASTILRTGDYGPTIRVAGPGGYIRDVSVRGLVLRDATESMTPQNSPYHVVFDGVQRGTVSDVTTIEGSGGVQLLGTDQIKIARTYLYATGGSPTQTVGSTLYRRTAIQLGLSARSDLPAPGNSDVWLQTVNIKGGDHNAGWHFDIGIEALACDGLWLSDVHAQGINAVNYRFARQTAASYLGNIYAVNLMSDISNGRAIVVDGPVQLGRTTISGQLSSFLLGGPGMDGVLVTGLGGVKDLTLDLGIEGYKGDGIRIDAANVVNVTIRPRQINNLAGGTAINLLTGTRLAIEGGLLGGDATLGTGVRFGAVTFATMTGTQITSVSGNGYEIGSGATHVALSGGQALFNGSYGGTIAAGANFVSITGMPHVGNGAAALQNSMGAGSYGMIANNLGM